MSRICSVYGKNAPYMHVYAKTCPVYAPYMQKNAPYMLCIWQKCPVYAPYMQKNAPYMLRIWKKCPVYARICPVYAPYMAYMHVYAPYMLRICSVYSCLTQWKKPIEPGPNTLQQYPKKVGAKNLKVSTCLFCSGNNRYILYVVMKSFSKRCL